MSPKLWRRFLALYIVVRGIWVRLSRIEFDAANFSFHPHLLAINIKACQRAIPDGVRS